VVQPVVEDHQVAHRMVARNTGVNAKLSSAASAKASSVALPRWPAGAVARPARRRRAGETDPRQPHHRDIVGPMVISCRKACVLSRLTGRAARW
jgi:hypothetical protein